MRRSFILDKKNGKLYKSLRDASVNLNVSQQTIMNIINNRFASNRKGIDIQRIDIDKLAKDYWKNKYKVGEKIA